MSNATHPCAKTEEPCGFEELYNKAAAERDQLRGQRDLLLQQLERILYAHDNYGNGAAMGEAVLCPMYAELARYAINEVKEKA